MPALVLENIRIAAAVLDPHYYLSSTLSPSMSSSSSGAAAAAAAASLKLVDVTCADERQLCSMMVPAYADFRNSPGRQAIVLCPLYFIKAHSLRFLSQCRLTEVQGSWF